MSRFNSSGRGNDMDQEGFIRAVEQGGVVLERATNDLIHQFRGYPNKFSNQFRRQGLEEEEAMDAYTDAVMQLIIYIRTQRLDLRYSFSTYLYRMTRNKCIDTLRRRGRAKRKAKEEIPLVPIPDSGKNALHQLLLNEMVSAVIDILEQIKGNCKELVLKWGYWGYSMQEIADDMGFKNAKVASAQKSRCLERLRQKIALDPNFPQSLITD